MPAFHGPPDLGQDGFRVQPGGDAGGVAAGGPAALPGEFLGDQHVGFGPVRFGQASEFPGDQDDPVFVGVAALQTFADRRQRGEGAAQVHVAASGVRAFPAGQPDLLPDAAPDLGLVERFTPGVGPPLRRCPGAGVQVGGQLGLRRAAR